MLDYVSNREEMTKKYKLAGIKRAVKEVDQYLETAKTVQVSHALTLTFYFSFLLQTN